MRRQVHFTRQQLHERVWSQPLAIVAAEIGISVVALTKACRRSGLPIPERRYWANEPAGQQRMVPKVPPPAAGQPRNILFVISEARPPKPSKRKSSHSEPPSMPVPVVVVPTQLEKPHALVVGLRQAANGAEEYNGVLLFSYEQVLRVRTSSRCLQRSLLLLDTLLKAFDQLGLRVQVGRGWRKNETELIFEDGTIAFRLDERTTKRPPPAPKTRAAAAWSPRYVLVGTGEFSLTFEVPRWEGLRNQWHDKPGRPLEQQLDDVMAAIPTWEATLRARRLRQEETAEKARLAEEQRVAEAKRREVLRRQRARLVGHLQDWERANRLRSFIAAVEAAGDQSTATLAWLLWAKLHAAALDPVQSDLSRVTNLAVSLDGYSVSSPYEPRPPRDWWD